MFPPIFPLYFPTIFNCVFLIFHLHFHLLPHWTLKDTISLLTLSRIFGAGNYALIKDLKLPRFDRFNRREIKARFNNLEKRRIVLRLKDDKTKFFVNHGDLKHIIDENEKRQIWFIQNNRELFNEKLLGQTKFDQSLQRLLC